jgi:hypothetical protein
LCFCPGLASGHSPPIYVSTWLGSQACHHHTQLIS